MGNLDFPAQKFDVEEELNENTPLKNPKEIVTCGNKKNFIILGKISA